MVAGEAEVGANALGHVAGVLSAANVIREYSLRVANRRPGNVNILCVWPIGAGLKAACGRRPSHLWKAAQKFDRLLVRCLKDCQSEPEVGGSFLFHLGKP